MNRNSRFWDLRMRETFFILIKKGIRKFDIQIDDKDYKPGDLIKYREFKNEKFTGESTIKRITYILRKNPGLMYNHLVIGFEAYE